MGSRARQSTSWHRAVDGETASGMGSERKQKLANDSQWAVGAAGQGHLLTQVVPCLFSLTQVQTQLQVLCCRQLTLEASFCQVMWEGVGEILRDGWNEGGNDFRERW